MPPADKNTARDEIARRMKLKDGVDEAQLRKRIRELESRDDKSKEYYLETDPTHSIMENSMKYVGAAAAAPAATGPPHPAFRNGKTALITGGASGIGLASAKRCVALGMSVAILDPHLPTGAEDATDAAQLLGFAQGDAVFFLQYDVSDHAAVLAAHSRTLELFSGGIDFLFLNAGIAGGGGPFTNLAGWKAILDVSNHLRIPTKIEPGFVLCGLSHHVLLLGQVNLWGVLNMLEQFMPSMLAHSEPSVVAVPPSHALSQCNLSVFFLSSSLRQLLTCYLRQYFRLHFNHIRAYCR